MAVQIKLTTAELATLLINRINDQCEYYHSVSNYDTGVLRGLDIAIEQIKELLS